MNLAKEIEEKFLGEKFTLKQVYNSFKKPKTTLRARIYENIDKLFIKVDRGLYKTIQGDCILMKGNGRDLSIFEDGVFDCLINDHPWDDEKSNLGGDRKFANEYNCFKYTLEDFKEKARVLKDGSFLVEILPSENENNFEYLYNIKKMALESGFLYYSKVAWKKGNFVSNTGRKSKNTEEVMIFSKGKARELRLDSKRTKALGTPMYMSGTNKMLPTEFNVEPVSRNNKVHQSEKPVGLFEEIIEYVTLENECILDQYAGSGALGVAAIRKKRKCFLIEILQENIDKIKSRLNMSEYTEVNLKGV